MTEDLASQSDAIREQTVAVAGESELESVDRLKSGYERIRRELARVIVGQDDVLEQILVAVLTNGHVILEGVPGLAKTLMISTTARCLALSFSRIQFTPDLMPSDITGTEVIQEVKSTGHRELKFIPGPIFANVILADEINRTPPKTQAALLEAMQERQVTIGNQRHLLSQPFFVLATQNPIEQEGTYPLPEAQLDRFLFKVFVEYPSYDQEYEIAERTTVAQDVSVSQVFAGDEIIEFQRLVRRLPAARNVIRHALDLVRATRPDQEGAPDFVKKTLTWAAGPRAVQALILGGKALAALRGRYHLSTDDVRDLAKPVLRHRIVTNYSAEAEGYTPDRVVSELLDLIRPHETDVASDEQFGKLLSS